MRDLAEEPSAQATADEEPPPAEDGRALFYSRDRINPSLYESIAVDPTISMSREAVKASVEDLRSGYRRFLFPLVKPVALVAIYFWLTLRRIVPFKLDFPRTLSWLTVTFLRLFVSVPAKTIIVRHLQIENRLIKFVARNSGDRRIPLPDLEPTRAEQLGTWNGQNTIIHHDANIFNLFIDLGRSDRADTWRRIPDEQIDFSDLDIPALELEDGRILSLDLQTTLYIASVAIAMLADDRTVERAINSFQLDEGLLATIANITGDPVFRSWVPLKFMTWLGSPTLNPVRDFHWHFLVHEHAHYRLTWLRDRIAAHT